MEPLTSAEAYALLYSTFIMGNLRSIWLAGLLCVFVVFLQGSSCNSGKDPPGDGTLQLFYNVNVDAAPSMWLSNLSAIVIQSSGLTATFNGPGGPNLVLDPAAGTTTLAAHDRLLPASSYAVPSGFITQLQIGAPIVTFQFNDGSSVPVRIPSGPQTGWKVVVDESQYPNGYQIVAGQTTGVELFLTLGDLFHKTGQGHGKGNSDTWMARPTIDSALYNIDASVGYDPDILVVVFDPATDDATILNAITSRGYAVVNRYQNAPPKLYKIKLPSGGNLQNAHAYFRSLPYVLAAAPSVVLRPRVDIVPPSEGTPTPFLPVQAVTGWKGEVAANVHGRGTVGVPDAVVAEISYAGLNTHHDRLWPNVWLNQGEITWLCPLSACDVDRDGFVTLRDFNATGFPATLAPPHTGPIITCDDLIASGSPYANGKDNDGNGYVNDICGWNFGVACPTSPCSGGGTVYESGAGCFSTTLSPALEDAAHDTNVAGIIGALPNMTAMTSPSGGGVGVCWNCRIMVLAGQLGMTAPQTQADVTGFTFEFLAALAYATQNGAHVANFSAGALLNPSNNVACTFNPSSVDKAAFSTVVAELDASLSSTLDGAVMKAGHSPPLVTLAIEDDCGSVVDNTNPNNYDYPSQAFRDTSYSTTALTVVGTIPPTCGVGPGVCNPPPGPADRAQDLGADIGAPESFNDILLDDSDNSGISCSNTGSSFASPLVAGVAGLVVSGNLATFTTPNGPALRSWILSHDVQTDTELSPGVQSQDAITMQFLP